MSLKRTYEELKHFSPKSLLRQQLPRLKRTYEELKQITYHQLH